MTEGVKKTLLYEMLDDEDAFTKKPFKTMMKYMKKLPKYLKDGDITWEIQIFIFNI